jgi:ornithine carbamoyltransferase
MLADFLTMSEASRKPYDAISYCYMGDARSNMRKRQSSILRFDGGWLSTSVPLAA